MALREILAKFGFDVDDKKLLSAKKGVDGLAENVKNLAEKVLGGSASAVFKEWTGDVKDSAAEFRGLAKMTGTSAQEMQRWTTAAKLGGSSVEALAAGFRVLQKTAAAAAEGSTDAAGGMVDVGDGAIEAVLGSKQAAEAFKSLDVSVKDAQGQMKSATQLMGDVGLEIAKIESPVQRAALATKVFGRRGAELIPIFSKGEEGLSELLDTLDRLGGGVSQDALDALAKNGKATKQYDIAITSLKSKIVASLLPAFTKKIEVLTKVASWFITLTKNSNFLEAAIIGVSAATLILQRRAVMSGIKTAIAWAPTIIAFALIALLLDDLITLFKGGDSAIGRLIDTILGTGASAKVVDTLTNAFKSLDGVTGKLPIVLGAIALAIAAALSPIVAAGVAIAAITVAVKELQALMTQWDDQSWGQIWNKFKVDVGLKEDEGSDKALGLDKYVRKTSDLADPQFSLSPGVQQNASQMQSVAAFTGTPNLGPVIKVPTVTGAGPNQPVTKRVDMKNDVKIIVQGSGDDAIASAARSGVNQAFDDERRASLAALESSK